ncbi:cyclin f-box [Fusarium austroafricanum]|uniref:Cyclin f-box n=1 Tax=Fusarium austroafricanum TaxID=2364996 RepID=A0A8H4KDL5_9HYPO|nr:cyclin f-box [Fusarium austroafricanum]
MPSDIVALAANAITYLGDRFTLNPSVANILRTKYCIPGTIFLVERVQHISFSRSGKWQLIRLMLGDGKLCIQAILDPGMHRFVRTGDVAVGAYVRCDKFHAKWQEVGEQKQTMVTLVVQSLFTVGWNESYRALEIEDEFIQAPPKLEKPKPEEKGKGKEPMTGPKPAQDPPKQKDIPSSDELPYLFGDIDEAAMEETCPNLFGNDDAYADTDAEEAFSFFETLTFKPKTPQKPSKTPESPKAPGTPAQPITSVQSEPSGLLGPPRSHQPVAMPRDWHDPQTPLKLTILRQIPHLPYRQNWSCNVLAIISYLSEVEPSNLPPYRQRIARLADPSTAKQVHLTVFLDPEKFNPRVGSAVLLVGVKNHRYDGGSLKKYESDRKNGQWWWENPVEMTWCDVEGINDWWSQVTVATNDRD